MEKNSKYYVGLDIGTSSVGFCATDENYNLINKKGRDLWGVMLFDEAQTAEKRRAKRCARRGVQRQKERLMLLRSLFEKEIDKVDPDFFARLKASALWEDDKQAAGIFSRNSLFFDSKLNDKEFFKNNPTIYHLRKKCVETPAEDIRFLYLAIHNILKHRGNFLSESFNVENLDASGLDVLFSDLQNQIVGDSDLSDYEFLSLSKASNLSKQQKDSLKELDEELSKTHFKVSALAERLASIFDNKNSNITSLLKAISGGVVNAKSIFSTKENELEIDAKIDGFDVEPETFEQFVADVGTIGEQAVSIILSAKNIYDRITFKKILGNNKYFCFAMVDKFELHKEQLRKFKSIMKEFYPDQYNEMFKVTDHAINNYVKYIDGSNYASKEKKISSKCSRADFYKYVKKVLSSNEKAMESDGVKAIIQSIDEDNFLPKLRTSANSVIPYQVNKHELEVILNNAKNKYEFLSEKDDEGLTTTDKILSILEYRIPYFVGPLSARNSKNAWIVRRTDEKILPWNIESVVDYDKCEQEFIKRMQNNCSYLSNEPVLPKCSLLYSEYMVLQELNNLQINGQKLTREIKEKILEKYKEFGSVKISELKTFLRSEGFVESGDEISISGISDKLMANMNIYKNFNRILNGEIEKHRDEVEDIIAHATYMSDKSRLQRWLHKTYSNILDAKQIKEIKGLKISDWGKFSKKFLDGILGLDQRTGELRAIIQIMREEPLNLMEILAKYEFDALNVKQSDKETITYDDIEQLYCSPAVKRGTWQSVKIVQEIQKIMGAKPEKIFIEVTRADDEKMKGKMFDPRKDKMLKTYNSIKADLALMIKDADIKELKDKLSKEPTLDSKKLYLYFTQMGKCMYSGESISLDDIMKDTYDIDHIIPQSVIKDDSFDNLVLVKRQANIDKSNEVVAPEIQKARKSFWQYLNKNKLISNGKLARLLRTEKLSDEEKKDFVARQLVITNQSAKAVIDLFKSVYGSLNVVYSKAKYVSMFRNCEFKFDRDENVKDSAQWEQLKQSLIKCRDMNDLHHAKDAYLNIFVGNVFDEKYSRRFYLKDKLSYGFNLNNAFLKDMPSVLEKEKHLPIVTQTMQSNTPHIGFLSREKTGQFYKETIWGIDKHQKDFDSLEEIKLLKNDEGWNGGNIPCKSAKEPLSNTEKYGHLSDATYSYFSVVEYEQKGKTIKRFVEIPYIYAKDIKSDEDLIVAVEKIIGVKNCRVIMRKVNPGTIVKIGSGYFKIAGNTGNSIKLHNFNQLFLPVEMNEYFKAVSKAIKSLVDKKELQFDGENIVVIQNRFGDKKLVTKEKNLALYKELVKHLNKAIYKNVSIGAIGKRLKDTYDTFKDLDCVKQIETIKGLLDVINGSNGGNLANVGESKNSGALTVNKNINVPISIINYSPTGFYEKEIKLNWWDLEPWWLTHIAS